MVLLLLPLALQPTVVFGLSNNVLPFFPICHQLSPSSHTQHLKISFYFLFPSFPGSSPSSRPFQFLSEDLFWASYTPPFFPGDLTNLSFALLSILLYFILCSSLLVLDSSDFSIARFHIYDHIFFQTFSFQKITTACNVVIAVNSIYRRKRHFVLMQ